MLLVASILLLLPTSTASSVSFGPPVIVRGAWNTSTGLQLDGNESSMDSFYSLGKDSFMFGQYETHLSQGEAVFVASNDSGASWYLSGIRNPAITAVSPRCQKVMDQFCNNMPPGSDGTDCITPQTKHWGRSMAPYYARYDQALKFGAAWRCYSYESLSPDLKHWSPSSSMLKTNEVTDSDQLKLDHTCYTYHHTELYIEDCTELYIPSTQAIIPE